MGELTGAATRHVVRLESVAESVAADGVDAAEFAARFAERLARDVAEVGAVGVKSVAAYRTGLRLDPAGRPPTDGDSRRWRAGSAAGPGDAGWRMADPVLQRCSLWTAVDLGLPIQFHIGFGDSDIRMPEVDPTLLTDWLHLHRVPVMLLHCWPWHRQASLPGVHLPPRPRRRRFGPALRRARAGAPRCWPRRRGHAVHPAAVLLRRLRRPRAVPARARSPTGSRSPRCCGTGWTAGEWAAPTPNASRTSSRTATPSASTGWRRLSRGPGGRRP